MVLVQKIFFFCFWRNLEMFFFLALSVKTAFVVATGIRSFQCAFNYWHRIGCAEYVGRSVLDFYFQKAFQLVIEKPITFYLHCSLKLFLDNQKLNRVEFQPVQLHCASFLLWEAVMAFFFICTQKIVNFQSKTEEIFFLHVLQNCFSHCLLTWLAGSIQYWLIYLSGRVSVELHADFFSVFMPRIFDFLWKTKSFYLRSSLVFLSMIRLGLGLSSTFSTTCVLHILWSSLERFF